VLRVTCAGKVVAYSGDTGWTETLVGSSAWADLFICVTYTYNTTDDTSLSYRALMEHRDALRCKRLMLTHVGHQLQRHLADVVEQVAEDGLTITLS